MSKYSHFLNQLQKIDKRIIYAVFLIMVLIPLIFPIGIPIAISDYTRKFYDEVELLQKGDIVVMDLTYDAVGYPDVNYQTEALIHQLGRKGIDIYFLSGEIVAINYATNFRKILEEQYGYVYGVNLVISPYLAGMEQGVKTFASDVKGTFPTDAYGNTMDDFQLMQRINSVWDFKVAFTVGTSIAHEYWLKQVPGMKILAPIGTTMLANVTTYLDSGQIAAILPGVRSAAEYESLLDLPGNQIAKMDAQSLGVFTILFFILLGNIGYFLDKKSKARTL